MTLITRAVGFTALAAVGFILVVGAAIDLAALAKKTGW